MFRTSFRCSTKLLVVAHLVLLAACGPATSRHQPVAPEGTKEIPAPDRLYHSESGSFPNETRLVIQDSSAWNQAWVTATAHVLPAPPRPSVNFTTHMVIVVAEGPSMVPGDSLYVVGLRISQTRAVAMVRTVRLCGLEQMLTAPVDIVRIPRVEQRVVFEETIVRSSCL